MEVQILVLDFSARVTTVSKKEKNEVQTCVCVLLHTITSTLQTASHLPGFKITIQVRLC